MKQRNILTTLRLQRYLKLHLLGVIFFLSGCAVSLAPKFDQAIVDRLSDTSAEVFQLIAAASGGTSAADFTARAEKYDVAIGNMEALALQIKARPVPKNRLVEKITSKVNTQLQQKGISTLITAGDAAPSATALTQIVRNMVQMKNTDKAQGLKPAEVLVFKGFIELYMDQALTYERFLNQ